MVTQRDRDNRTERQQLMRPASRQLIGVPDPRPQQPVEFIPREFLPALRAATRAEPQAVAPQAAPQAEPQAEPQVTPQQDAGVTPSATSARYDPNNPYVAEAMRLEEKYNLPKGVFLALVQQESGFKPNAVSKAGAIGLAQLMPGTASGLNVDPRDPMQNLDGGARYLAEQIATFGDLSKGLAAYNAGPGAVRKAGNAIPNFPETQKYVAAVMRNAGYPMAPPKLADGGLIELARKYADGGLVAGAAQVYDPAVIAAIAASITEPQGYADGGTATGISSDDAAPAPAQERVQEQRPRTFADLVGRYGVGDADQVVAPLVDPARPSPGGSLANALLQRESSRTPWPDPFDYLRPVGQGLLEIPGTLKKYAIDVATDPKPFTRLGSDISTLGSAVWEGVKNDPVGTFFSAMPVSGEFLSLRDAHEFRNKADAAERAGDEKQAAVYRQLSAVGMVGAIPLVGMASRAANRGVKLGVEGAEAAARVGSEGAARKGMEGAVREGVEVVTEHPSMIDTRYPTGKARIDEIEGERLMADFASMQATPKLYEDNVNLVRGYVNMPESSGRGLTDEVAENFINHAKDNLLYLHDQVPDNIRQRSQLWYDGARKISEDWANEYGIADSAAAGAIAALSPQKDWYQNVSLAKRVVDALKGNGENFYNGFSFSPEMQTTYESIASLNKPAYTPIFDQIKGRSLGDINKLDFPDSEKAILKSMWIRLYDEGHNSKAYPIITPEGGFGDAVKTAKGVDARIGWGSMNEISKAIRAIESNGDPKLLNEIMGGKHKVRNFYNNILAPNSTRGDVTIDTHAVAASLMRPLSQKSVEVAHNFNTSTLGGLPGASGSAASGIQGTYPLYAEAYRRAAGERGILPRQMQSITWEAIRGLFPDTFKTPKNMEAVDALWAKYRAGEVSLDETREAVSRFAGGVNPPTWYRPSGAADESFGGAGNAPVVSGSGLPRKASGGIVGRGRGQYPQEPSQGHVQGYADGGSADNSLAALHEKYYGEPTTRQRPPTYEEMGNNPVGWSSVYPPQYMSNQDPNVSPVASRTLMSDAQRLGLLGRRGPVTGGDLPALEARGQGLMDNAMTVAGAVNPVGIRSFHGSPHVFKAERLVRSPSGEMQYIEGAVDQLPAIPRGYSVVQDFPLGRFRLDKMGTGEGAQAYGYGGYSAEIEGVGKGYRDKLSSKLTGITVDGMPLETAQLSPSAKSIIQMHMDGTGSMDKMRASNEALLALYAEQLKKYPHSQTAFFNKQMAETSLVALDEVKGLQLARTKVPGSMYELNLRTHPDRLLDWDKPLGMQPQGVREAIMSQPSVAKQAEANRRLLGERGADLSGQSAYAALTGWKRGAQLSPTGESAASATEALRKSGIDGIRYLDGGSRAAGTGSSNYVIFDDKLIDILRRYGLLGMVGGGAAAAGNKNKQAPAEEQTDYAQGGSVDDNASVLTSPDGDLIIVGIKHGEMPRLPRELRNNIRAAGNRHGFYYEGDGGDRAAVGRAFGEIDYKGSLDDGLDVPEERRPDFLYTLFSSNASKTPNLLNRLVDKDKTILESLYENKNAISHNSVRGKLRRNDIVQFLNKTEMRDYSMRPATRRNIKAFLERGEAQMWPDNWQDFPNPAGAVARDALELRLQAVIQRGSGVYFLGVDNLPILHGLAPRLQAKAPKTQAPAEEQTDYAQGGSVDSAPVYDPAVIAAIAASITEDDHA